MIFENEFSKQNYSLLCDFYELTMGCGYLGSEFKDKIAYFDLFFRRVPDSGGFAIVAGLEQIVEYIENLSFTENDIEFLRSKGCFSEQFLEYLRDFKFTGDIYAIPEGTPVFPGEPLITVRAPVIEAQFIETYLLLTLNHQSLIATKANRIRRAAQGRTVSEFGSRRAQGVEGAILGARASYIGGCNGTACTIAEKWFGVPAGGTMAHSWVQMFDSEYEAFDAYCKLYPDNPTLLIDTYNVLKSGLPNAIRVFKEHNITKCAIRIDSGDIAYLSKKIRKRLDEAGMTECRIVASNSLDEYIIRDLLQQGAQIDAFGVGERLVTSKSDPVFGGVYKLVAVEDEDGSITPKIKISENAGKITIPCYKKVYRIFENETGKAAGDLICTHDEVIDTTKPLTIFDPDYTWKEKTFTDYTIEELQKPIFIGGKRVYDLPTTEEIRTYCLEQIDRQWDEVKRFENPHSYYVDLSQKLWNIQHELLEQTEE
ncbi:MAG: nicotinate phosphoribosyltransferase [Clostridia bacterium]|nr:nicotinate phosphoribosyltransferase [Clostridia bacterium]